MTPGREKWAAFAAAFAIFALPGVFLIKPSWLCACYVASLFAVAIMTAAVSPPGTGYVPDNAITFAIIAIILLFGMLEIGRRIEERSTRQLPRPVTGSIEWSGETEIRRRPL